MAQSSGRSRGCAEQDSWPHLLPVAPVEKAAPVTCPVSIVELALVAGVWLSQPESVSVKELTLHSSAVGWHWHRGDASLPPIPLSLAAHMVMSTGELALPPQLTGTLRRVGPVLRLGYTWRHGYGASPEGMSMGEPTLLPGSTGRPSWSSLEGSPVHKGELMGDQLSYHSGPELVYCKI